ncbi:MAG: Lipopolysaccharide biosynthesis chain length determinant protein, partial [Labilithrix sp.]|nr:Lipopolysaccharide biosynthesis chain length determinant protein [Labilithrix sp.]
GDCIVQEAVVRRTEQAKVLKDFLDAESERNKTELKNKEADLAKFLALHPEFAPPPGTPLGTMPTARPAGQATRPAEDPAILALEARAARIERQLKGPGAPAPTPTSVPTADPGPLPDSPELVAARRDLAEKLTRYTDKHPDVIAAKNRVRAAEAAQAAARAAQPAPTPVQPAPAPPEDQRALSPEEQAALKKQLAQIVNEIAIRRAVLKGGSAPTSPTAESPVSLEVEYRRLLHEVTETRDRQRQLDEKQFKAAITASSVMSDRNIQVSVLDPAFLPSHAISQPRSQMLMVGFAIGIFLAIIVAFVSARLDDRIHDRVDLEVLDILPVVGVIPRLPPGNRSDRGWGSTRTGG